MPRVQRGASLSAATGMVHAMLHVLDMEESLSFYKRQGMRLLSNRGATAFVGYGGLRDMASFSLELAAKPELRPGSFGGLTLAGEEEEELGDPNGYRVQTLAGEPMIREICLQTGNLEKSVAFYTEKLGMMVKSKDGMASQCQLGYASGPQTSLCLRQSDSPIDVGTGFDHLVFATADVPCAAETLQAAGVPLVLPPTVMFGVNITGIVDADGYKVYLVDEADYQRR